MAKRKISPNLEKEIIAKAAEGLSTRAIAEWLGTQGVNVSHVAVAALLRQTREARADVAKAVTREALRPHVTSDLDRLEEIRVEVAERRRNAVLETEEDFHGRTRKACSHLDFARLAQLEVDILDRKLKLSGAKDDEGEPKGGVVLLPPMEDN